VQNITISQLLCKISPFHSCCAKYHHFTAAVQNITISQLLCKISPFHSCCAKYQQFTAAVQNIGKETPIALVKSINGFLLFVRI